MSIYLHKRRFICNEIYISLASQSIFTRIDVIYDFTLSRRAIVMKISIQLLVHDK